MKPITIRERAYQLRAFPLFAATLTALLNLASGTYLHSQTADAIVAAGNDHSIAINAPGTLWTWGENRDGQLGTGDALNRATPVKVSNEETWIAASAGDSHTVLVRGDGTLWGSGDNLSGQLGLGAPSEEVELRQIGSDSDWAAVAAGADHTLALKTNGTLWAFGANGSGQLGDGTNTARVVPVQIGADTYTSIAAGRFHSLAVRSDGALFAWGGNGDGQLGQGEEFAQQFVNVPTQVGADTDWDVVSAGGFFSLALKASGALWAWGRQSDGQLGDGPILTDRESPVAISAGSFWEAVSAGERHTLLIASDGTLWAMGRNFDGQLGTGSNLNEFTPKQISTATDWISIAAGARHSLAVRDAATDNVFAVGNNSETQLGIGDGVSSASTLQGPLEFIDLGVVDPRPDLEIVAGSISFTVNEEATARNTATFDDSLTVNFRLRNNGATFENDTAVINLIRRTASVETVIATLNFTDQLVQDAVVALSFSLADVEDSFAVGLHDVGVRVDPSDAISESDESNNEDFLVDGIEIFDLPDFVVQSLTVDEGERRPNADLSFLVTLRNDGGTYRRFSPSIPLEFRLSTDGTIGNPDDLVIGTDSEFPSEDFITDSTLEIPVTFLNNPATIPAGDYFIVVTVNPEGTIEETADGGADNNTLFTAETFDYDPDYVISTASLSTTDLLPGDLFDFTVSVRNTGSNVEDGATDVFVELVLSANDTIGDLDDISVGSFSFDTGLAFGEVEAFNETLSLPISIDSDNYFAGLIVNSTGSLVELDTANNTFNTEQIIPIFPDLVLDVFSVPATGFTRSSDVGFKAVVRNQGNDYFAGAEPIEVEVWLTEDGTVGDPGDVQLIAATPIQHAGDLLTGESFEDNAAYTVPALPPAGSLPAGTYFVAGLVDPPDGGNGVVTELDESVNNQVLAGPFDLFADLIVQPLLSGQAYTPGTFDPGDALGPLSVDEIVVTNNSQFDLLAGANLQIRLSRNQIWGDVDDVVILQSTPVAALGAQESDILDSLAAITIPEETPAGSYFLAVRVDFDGAIAEANETNNTRFSNLIDIVISGADVAEALEDHLLPRVNPAIFEFDKQQGLVAKAIGSASWFGQENMVFEGAEGTRSGVIAANQESSMEFVVNVPPTAGEFFNLSFYWKVSSEPGFDTLSFFVDDELQASISGDVPTFQEVNLTLASGIRTLRWTYAKDDSVTQGSDAGWVDSLTISAAQVATIPDFVITSLNPLPGERRPGVPIGFDVALRNLGATYELGSAPIPVEFRLTANPTVGDADDIILGTFDVILADNFLTNTTLPVNVTTLSNPTDIPSGNYNFAAIVNPGPEAAIPEGDTANNVFVTPLPESQAYDADYVVDTASLSTTDLLPGDSFDFSVNVLNTGANVSAGSVDVEVSLVLTTDDEIGDANDVPIGSFTFNDGLTFNESILLEQNLSLPTPLESAVYFVGFIVNSSGSLAEIDDTNNSFVSSQDVGIFPDLLIEVFSVPQTNFDRGEEIGFKARIRNQGGTYRAGPNPPVIVEIWLTEDDVVGDPEDIQLTALNMPIQHLGDLASGEFFEDNEPYVVPGLGETLVSGTYFVAARVDPPMAPGGSGVVSELDDLVNNQKLEGPFDLLADLIVLGSGANGNLLEGTDYTAAAVNRADAGTPVEIANITIENDSQFDLGAATSIQIRLSTNRTWGDADDVILLESEPVSALGGTASENLGPFALEVPSDAATGAYFIGVRVDFEDTLVESVDTNNTRFTQAPDIIVNGATVGEAIEDHLPLPSSPPDFEFDVRQGFVASQDGAAPWFSQSAMVFADTGTDAAQSGEIADSEETSFEVTVDVPEDEGEFFEVSFQWAVSSEPGFDTLSFFVNDTLEASISGEQTTFEEVLRTLETGVHVLRWTYSKDSSISEGADAGWVDSLTISAAPADAQPDLEVTSVVFEPGTRVLQLDTLSVNVVGRNSGSAADLQSLPSDFTVRVYLSADPDFLEGDDILLGELTMLRDLDSNAFFNFQGELQLADSIDPGDYHLVVQIDATDLVDELDDVENNLFISDQADITIEARPDLVPTSLNFDPGFFLFGETLTLDFDVANVGLERSSSDFVVRVVLSENRNFTEEIDFVLTEIPFSGVISSGQSRSFASTIQIDDDTPIGIFEFLGIVVDAGEAVTESDETNNTFGSDDRDLFFAAVELEEALDLDEAAGAAGAAGGFSITNNEDVPFDDADAPWFGQTDETFDGIDAARSGNIGDSDVSSFSITVVPEARTVVAFRWRSSSEFSITEDGQIREDFLRFVIDDVEQTRISGIRDWDEESFVLEPGEHKLEWEYVKNNATAEGDDAGYVDQISLIVPDLTLSDLSVTAGQVSPGQDLDVGFTISNEGIADVPATPPYTVSVVLSLDDEVDGTDFILEEFTRNDGLSTGSSLDFDLTLEVPAEIAFPGFYQVIVTVDSLDVIPEGDEDNNQLVSAANSLEITLPISLQEALDYPDPAADPDPWTTFGNGVWFPQGDRELADTTRSTFDGIDAVEAPALGFNESSTLEVQITGPALLEWRWKVSAEPVLKQLSVEMNGNEQTSISGDVDWTQESLFIPAGTQIISFVWSSLTTTATAEDAAWIDTVTVTPVTDPELVIRKLTVTPGEYVLDITLVDNLENSTLGTQFLEIAVEVENQGVPINAGAGFFTVADVEVRLSPDDVYGNEDDIILGEFARVETTFDQAQQAIFIGPITLGDNVPEDDYFVFAKVDPLEVVTEVDDSNNLAVTDTASVQVTRLPNLEIFKNDEFGGLNIDIDETKIYFTQEAVQFDFIINNNGLDIVPGDTEWDVDIQLRAISKEALQGLADTFDSEGTLPATDDDFAGSTVGVIPLQSFSEKVLMFGRRDGFERGDALNITVFAFLPHFDRLETLIGENESPEDYLYFFQVDLDTQNVIRESDETRDSVLLRNNNIIFGFSTAINNPGLLDSDMAFEIRFNPGSIESEEWTELYLVSASETQDSDADGLSNNLEFALNRNPLVADASADLLSSFGFTEVENVDYLTLTFDIVLRASDLEYEVQNSADGILFDPLFTFTPPYDDLVGSDSLNGDGGVVQSNDVVLSAVENGFTARVTVRDDETGAMRFMRLAITDTDGTGPAFTTAAIEDAEEDSFYSYSFAAEDDPTETITLSAPTLPAWLNLVVDAPDIPGGTATATISGTPALADVGEHTVVLRAVSDGATDAFVTPAFQSFTITVTNAP